MFAGIAFTGGRLWARQDGTGDGPSTTTASATEDCDSNGTPEPCDLDCNATGRADDLEIFMGTSRDCDADRVPDECQVAVPGDIDGDGDVDLTDRSLFAGCHRPLSPAVTAGCETADLNGDGRVDCADWAILHCAWREGEPPAYPRCRTPAGVSPIDD